MTPIRWFQSLFSRSIHLPRRRRTAERLAPSRLDVLEKRVLLSATELVVTTNQDVTSNTDGLITLREALAFAASNPGADTITFGDGSVIAGGTNFSDATADTITLGGTELRINSNVTLDGPGAALLSISGNNASRVFRVNSGFAAEIRDVTITGGNLPNGLGGGIVSFGTLTVSHSTISGNGTGYGGGIWSNGTLTVSHSTISGNTASVNGGGIYSFGTSAINHSTISGNTAGGSGGGIVNQDGSTTTVNSTLVNNRADSDGNNTGTGGGIWTFNDNQTFTTLHNTIVAGNSVGTGTTASDVANKPLEAASRSNLIGDAGSSGGLTNGTNGNIVGALVADIFETGVLANNGGPTQTMAIKLGGPAVNAGDNASVPADTLDLDGDLNTTEPVPFDQRGSGFSRFVGTAVDIGAFEFKETPGLVVTTNQDVTSNTDGLITLREAFAFAASNPGDDTITFGNGSAIAGGTNFTDATADTITLGGTQLTINSNVTLDGPGAALLSISGNNASRVFRVNSGITTEIRDVTITSGNSGFGSGIWNNGTLAVSHSTISGNAASSDGGGIGNSNATLTVRYSTISGNTASGNAGGIWSNHHATVSHTTISGNTAGGDGGSIDNGGTMTVSHSTISGNTAGDSGGGIRNVGTLTVSHSTIAGNAASGNAGGIYNQDDSTTIVNSTLVNNRADSDGDNIGTGGGIWTLNDNFTFTTLRNTIVAGNVVGTGTTASDVASKPLEAASRNSLIGDAGSAGGLTNGTNGNIVGALVADIFETGALANNGGPTQTIALKASSPAVNAGDNASVPADALDLDGDLNTTEPVPFDQRGTGFVRIVGTSVDIGAIEADETPGLVVTTTQDVVNSRDGLISLREALAFAASNPGADTITFGNGSAIAGGTNFTDATADTITLGGTELSINSNVTLDGPGAALLSISGNNASRVFSVNFGVTAEIREVAITGGNLPNGLGGGILSNGTLTVSHSTISGNGTGHGGGIWSSGTLTVSHSAISGNTARHGGGISNSGTLMVSHSSISGNAASGEGGGIDNGGTLTVSHSTISGNTAGVDGGGIRTQRSMTVSHSTIFGNAANRNGGGIYNFDRSGTIVNSTFVNNRADSDGNNTGTGGGIWTWNDNQTFTTLRNTILAGNLVGTGTTANDVANKHLEAVSRNNVIGDAGSSGGLTNGTNGNIVGALVADIFETGVLANNGGPTQTIALKASSPAVNAGDNTSVPADALDLDGDLNTTEPTPFDQRGTGFPRVIGGIVDIGAYERANSTPTDVTLSSNTIAENAGANVVIGSLAGVDLNPNDALTLSLPTGLTDNALFNLSGGNLQANASFDFEANSSYTVTIRVTDFDGATFDKPLTISVTDVNEAPTALALQNTTTSLAENTSTATAIKLADISVTDDALGTNVLSVSGTDAAFFEIVGRELRLVASTMLDFEAKSSYSVTVEVNDSAVGGAVDASAAFTLTLTNVLDTTANADAFRITFSGVNVTITHSINAGLPVTIGTFPLNAPIVLNGLAANDSVRVLGTANADLFAVSSAGLVVNGTTVTLTGPASRTLVGAAGNDVYQFDADSTLGAWTLDESGGGIDTVDFTPTTTVGLVLNLATAGTQSVHATNLSLVLGSATTIDNAIGGAGADTLFGNSRDNTLTGGAGNDRLIGAGGNNVLLGGADNDTYIFVPTTVSEAAQVTENPNEGVDTLSFAFLTTDVVVDLGLTSAQTVHLNRELTLNSAVVIENIFGGTGADMLTGNSLANTLSGGAGDDRLIGGAGNDSLFGGANNDTYVFAPSSGPEADQVSENLNDGIDTLSLASITTDVLLNLGSSLVQSVHTDRTLKLNSAGVFENIIGGTGADTLFGNSLNNTLTGGVGNDRLIGAGGNDLLLGGADNDTYIFVPTTIAEADQVNENPNEGVDTLSFAFLTTDVVVDLGLTSAQTVHVNRTLTLNSAVVIENIFGGTGADMLTGNSLNNTLSGGAGNDRLIGGAGNDLLVGGVNDDTYVFVPASGLEADRVTENINEGNDTLSFVDLTTGILLNLGSSFLQSVHSNRTLMLNSAVVFENIVGGTGADTLFGNSLDNTLTGGAGNDKLIGAAGNDSLIGGANDDIYLFVPSSGPEADQVTENANEGVDTINFAYLATSVVLDLGSTAIQSVHANRTLKLNSMSTFEYAVGGTGSDTLLGNAAANRLTGGEGDNILVGMEAGDILEAGSGRDILIGGLGLDILIGGDGDDLLIAGLTTSDASLSNLSTLRTQWISANAYADRITNLRAGVGSPVVSLKTTINVLNDAGEDDVLVGGTGTDWFFRAVDDVIADLFAGELIDVL